jgi:hypothetical protein
MIGQSIEEFRRSMRDFELLNDAMNDFSHTYEQFGADANED